MALSNSEKQKQFRKGKKTIQITISEELHYSFKLALAMNGTTAQNVLETAVSEYCQKNGIDNL